MYREPSESGYYHVVQKGAGNQLLFERDCDFQRYLKYLARFAGEEECTVIAWCLMSNHVHLLLRVDFDVMSVFMHRLGLNYAQYFNSAMGHSGPVFKQSYFSEPVMTDGHLFSAIRYIHNNPYKAGICRPAEYRWSSYGEYLSGKGISNCDLLLRELGGGPEAFERFSALPDDFISSIEENACRVKLSDQEAADLATRQISPTRLRDMKALPKRQRDRLLLQLRRAGIGISQLSRITGIGVSTVSRACKGGSAKETRFPLHPPAKET